MDLKKIFEQHIEMSKRYVKLQDEGISRIEAAYKVFGTEVGDAVLKIKQREIIKSIINN